MQGQHGIILETNGADVHVEFQSGKQMWIQMRSFQLVIGTDPTKLVMLSLENRYYTPPIPSGREFETSGAKGFECRSCGAQTDEWGDAETHVQAGCFGMGAAKQRLLDDADENMLKEFVAAGGDPKALPNMSVPEIEAWVKSTSKDNEEAEARPDQMKRDDAKRN